MDKVPKILIKHSRIEINDYDIGDAPRLEYLFSVWDPIRHEPHYTGIEYNPVNKKLVLPRGMDIEYLKNIFMAEPIVDREPDPFINTDPIPIKYKPKDERQLEILKFILGEGKYKYTKAKSQLSVNSTTGSGKTFLTVAAICFLGCRSMIITSNTNWLEQWKARILEYTNLSSDDIYMIIGKGSINKLLARKNPERHLIFLASHSTIKSYGDNYGWDKVEELFKYLKISMKIFDEAHLYFDNMSKIDYHSNTKKTLYLTATPERSNKDEDVIYQQYFKNIPSISLFDENSDPHVNYISMMFKSHPSPYDVRRFSKGQFGFDRNTYISYIVDRPNFLKLITILVDMCMNISGKVLIYVGTNEGIVKVYNHIVNEFPFLVGHVGIYTSLTSNEQDKQENLRKKFILSTTKSCGAASDIADLAVTIVLAEPFKSPVLARQTLGRCRADNTLYIDVTDASCYRTKMYNKQKKNIFLQYAKSCKEVWMEDNELDKRVDNIHNKYQTKKVMCMTVYKE